MTAERPPERESQLSRVPAQCQAQVQHPNAPGSPEREKRDEAYSRRPGAAADPRNIPVWDKVEQAIEQDPRKITTVYALLAFIVVAILAFIGRNRPERWERAILYGLVACVTGGGIYTLTRGSATCSAALKAGSAGPRKYAGKSLVPNWFRRLEIGTSLTLSRWGPTGRQHVWQL